MFIFSLYLGKGKIFFFKVIQCFCVLLFACWFIFIVGGEGKFAEQFLFMGKCQRRVLILFFMSVFEIYVFVFEAMNNESNSFVSYFLGLFLR